MGSKKRILTASVSIFLFILGLQLLGESTQAVAESLRSIIKIVLTGDISSLGAGWFMAYVVLNGATSAAIGIAFLESGIIDLLGSFMFVSGSRLGASFIVVLIGILEYMQGKNDDLRDSCSIGIIQFITTYIVYIPAVILGYLGLKTLDLSILKVSGPSWLTYGLDTLFGPITTRISSILPPSAVFIGSILLLVVSLRIFDRAFQGLGQDQFRSDYLRFKLTNHWIAFGLGALITLVTTSVSLSVGIIVPMYNRGYFKRKEIIPYLMGANLTTMISAIMAAIVIKSALAMQAVLTLTIAVAITTIVVLALYNKSYQLVQKIFNTIMIEDKYMIAFTILLAIIPVLMVVGF